MSNSTQLDDTAKDSTSFVRNPSVWHLFWLDFRQYPSPYIVWFSLSGCTSGMILWFLLYLQQVSSVVIAAATVFAALISGIATVSYVFLIYEDKMRRLTRDRGEILSSVFHNPVFAAGRFFSSLKQDVQVVFAGAVIFVVMTVLLDLHFLVAHSAAARMDVHIWLATGNAHALNVFIDQPLTVFVAFLYVSFRQLAAMGKNAPMGVELDRRVTEIMRERRGWLARSTVEEERVGIAARYNSEHLSPSTTPPKP